MLPVFSIRRCRFRAVDLDVQYVGAAFDRIDVHVDAGGDGRKKANADAFGLDGKRVWRLVDAEGAPVAARLYRRRD